MEIKLFIAGIILLAVSGIMHYLKKNKNREYASSNIYMKALEWVDTLWSALLMASVLMYFVIQAFKIPSGSMRMTLIEGDHLFVNKFIYGLRVPFSGGKKILALRKIHRGDIFIFVAPQSALSPDEREQGITKDFIKRCIGLPGDKIEVINKKVYVNNIPQDEKYLNFEDDYIIPKMELFKTQEEYQQSWEHGRFTNLPIRDNFGPVIVPPNCYFAMGDNRDRSSDSRFWGPVSDKLIKGRALVLYWPLARIKLIK